MVSLERSSQTPRYVAESIMDNVLKTKLSLALIAIGLVLNISESIWAQDASLRVSQNGHFIEQSDGKPFFFLGDTAWELFQRLNKDETIRYLDDRASKRFNVILAVVLSEFDALHKPNRFGELPLTDQEPTHINEKYFAHIDWVIEEAAKRNIYLGLLPSWGDKWNKKWGIGPEIFNQANAKQYGTLLGKRYHKHSNIIWVLGGDRNPETDTHRAIVTAMAHGLREGDGGTHLMTFHPQGYSSSSKFFHDTDWLDFNFLQSSHGALDVPNYKFTLEDYDRKPAKPVIEGEPRYEDHPVNWKPELGRFEAFDVRQAAYWSMLSGAAGHTFGNNNIFQFFSDRNPPIASARKPWEQAIKQPGADDMTRMRNLFELRPWWRLVPSQSLLTANEEGAGYQTVAQASDDSFLIAYSPLGKALKLNTTQLEGDTANASWYDPRTAEVIPIGTVDQSANATFQPPQSGRGSDYVLVIDAANAELKPLK